MTDLTPFFKNLIETKSSTAFNKDISSVINKKESLIKGWEWEFVDKAYDILDGLISLNDELILIEPLYLNVSRMSLKTGMSESERDEFDSVIKVKLNQSLDSIMELEQQQQAKLEIHLKEIEKKNSTLLTRWLPEEWISSKMSLETNHNDLILSHLSSITWYLNLLAMNLSNTQKNLQHKRLARDLDRQLTFKFQPNQAKIIKDQQIGGWDVGPSNSTIKVANDVMEREDEGINLNLTDQQLIMFAQENDNLLKHYQSKLEQVHLAEKSLLEISSMQATLSMHIQHQSQQATRLFSDAKISTINIQAGNDSLVSATKNQQQSRKFMLIFFLLSSLSLLFLDWFQK